MLEQRDGVLTIRMTASVLLAAKKMRRYFVGSLVVVDDDGQTQGIVTERDVVARMVAEGLEAEQVCVADIMTRDVVSVTTNASIIEVQGLMAKHKIRHLPVIEDGLLLGMISSRDIVCHQLAGVKSILAKQMELFQHLEEMYPEVA